MSRLKFKDLESVNLKYISSKDNVGTLIDKINNNFREIQNNGGGPMGPIGPQGPPGCRGQNGAPGKDGENIVDEWIKKFALGCDGQEVHNIEDVIMNKSTDRTLLLTNLITLNDNTFELREIGADTISVELIVSELSDYKLKIYNSNLSGIGQHLHFANTLAMTNGYDGDHYRCKSGFTFSLDWHNSSQETLRLVGEKNSNIINHMHIFELDSDLFKLKHKSDTQTWIFDAGSNTSAFTSTITLDTLKTSRIDTFPDRSGYVGIWEDTLEHSETWEIVEESDIKITYSRYNAEFSDPVLENGSHFVYMDSNSTIRFKRMNNWVLVDYHIGVSNIQGYNNFYLKNIQFKVNKTTIGCKTLGWDPSTIVDNEDIVVPDDSYADQSLFRITSGDFAQTADTFMISIRMNHSSSGIHFTSGINEEYWLTGQILATIQTEDESCIDLDVEQDAYCPPVQI